MIHYIPGSRVYHLYPDCIPHKSRWKVIERLSLPMVGRRLMMCLRCKARKEGKHG